MDVSEAGLAAGDDARAAAPAELRRGVGLPAAVALVVSGTVGVGIFLTPAGMARDLASPALLLLVWVFLGAATLCGALCFGELAARFPAAGGNYVYLRQAYGPAVAFLYGWKCMLVMDPGITALLAVGLASYVAYIAPLSAAAQKVVAVVTIAGLAGLNVIGGGIGAWVMQVF